MFLLLFTVELGVFTFDRLFYLVQTDRKFNAMATGRCMFMLTFLLKVLIISILGDPGADSEGDGKSKRAGKYGTKKRKERREEPLGTMSYQTSSKRSSPFCLLIDWAEKHKSFLAPIRSQNDRDSLELVW